MSELKKVLMERDNLSSDEADQKINVVANRVISGEDAETLLMEEFGLEPDYLMDLLDYLA